MGDEFSLLPLLPRFDATPTDDGPSAPALASGRADADADADADAAEVPVLAFADRYQPVALLGQGSYAEVFRALDRETGQEIALKVLHDRVSDTAVWPAQETYARELATVRALQHPGVVPILDAGYVRDPFLAGVQRPALVMPVVEGETLADVIARGVPWSVPAVVQFLDATCAILTHLQAHGVVHRDLGPQNVYRTRDGRFLLSDFGLARPLDSAVVTRLTGTLTGALAARLLYIDYANQSGVVTGASDLVSVARIGLALLRGAHYTGPVRTPPAGAEALVALLNTQAADGATGDPATFRHQLARLSRPATALATAPAPRVPLWCAPLSLPRLPAALRVWRRRGSRQPRLAERHDALPVAPDGARRSARRATLRLLPATLTAFSLPLALGAVTWTAVELLTGSLLWPTLRPWLSLGLFATAFVTGVLPASAHLSECLWPRSGRDWRWHLHHGVQATARAMALGGLPWVLSVLAGRAMPMGVWPPLVNALLWGGSLVVLVATRRAALPSAAGALTAPAIAPGPGGAV